MIAIPRGPCRALPAQARKCVSGRPRGPAPVVVFEVTGGALSAWARTDDAVLAYTAATDGGDGVLVVPMAVLEAVAGPGTGPVELTVGPGLAGEARWSDRGVPRSHRFEAVLPGQQHRLPDVPGDGHTVPAALLTALHECGRTAARDAGRFALTRVQVRGRAGQVVATDGRTALLWGGFEFPFTDDVLVPAVPVFGARELGSEREVRIGRTATHLVVGVGPWRVFLAVDAVGRYPDVAGVVPRDAPTMVALDERDAAVLSEELPGLPGGDSDHRPVTLAADGAFVVRAGDTKNDQIREVRLRRSTATGPGVRVAIDHRVLSRALHLGCRTVRLCADRPVAFECRGATLLTATLDPHWRSGRSPMPGPPKPAPRRRPP